MTRTPQGPHAYRTRHVLAEHWASHRDLRLRMLREAPDAFVTTLAQASERDEQAWRRSLLGPACFWQALSEGGTVVGGLGLVDDAKADASTGGDPTSDEHLLTVVAMYVQPEHRGGAVTRLLFTAAAEHAQRTGAAGLRLHVVDDNAAARRSYERLGLRPTGVREPDPHRPDHEELEYAARIEDLVLDGPR